MGRMAGGGGGRVAGDIGSAVIPAQWDGWQAGEGGRVAGDIGSVEIPAQWDGWQAEEGVGWQGT